MADESDEAKHIDFEKKILEQVYNDVNDEGLTCFLPLELFVGYIKILTVS
jgi:hypothetical protein